MSDFDKWLNKTLWTQTELKALCAGLNPPCSFEPHLDELGEIEREIDDSISEGCLIPRPNSVGNVLYGHHQKFRPQEAIAWAANKYPKFPFKPQEPSVDLNLLQQENELLKQQLNDAQAKIEALEKQLDEYQEKPLAIKTVNKVMPLIYHLCCQHLNKGDPIERPVEKTLSRITDDLKNTRGIKLTSDALENYYKLGEEIIREKNS